MKKLLLLVCMMVMMSGTCLAFIPVNNPEPVLCIDAVSKDRKHDDSAIVYLKVDTDKYTTLYVEDYRIAIVDFAYDEEKETLAGSLSIKWPSNKRNDEQDEEGVVRRKVERDAERIESFVLPMGETKELDVNGLKITLNLMTANRPNGAVLW